MTSLAVPLCPAQEGTHPFVQYLLTAYDTSSASHSNAISYQTDDRGIAVLCSSHSYFT